jgi:hypothetical protein
MKTSRLTVRSMTVAALIGAAIAGFGGGIANAADSADGLHGDPGQVTQYWVRQTLDDCSLMATADVVGQLTGDQPSEHEIVALAGATPSAHHDGVVYLPPSNTDDPNAGNGTDSRDLPILLAHYGIAAVYTDDGIADATNVPTGMDALVDVLDAGKKVIAGVNAETIWDEDGDHTIGDHDLVVTGVDTNAGIVHLNDSGTDDGADELVPIDVFEAAWETSGHDMVITN